MITKKKLKTKIDYQIRTFGFCIALITVFVAIFIMPHISSLNNENALLKNELQTVETSNATLQNEFEQLTNVTQIKNEE